MSHYVNIKTRITEQRHLVQALKAMGYNTIEVHEIAQPLFGYRGDRRPETAEVIIRRQYVGSASNDVGFKKQASGEIQAIISEYDRRTHCPESFLQRLCREYAHQTVLEYARERPELIFEWEDRGDERIYELKEKISV